MKVVTLLLTATALLAAGASPLRAGRVTVDPNASKSSAALQESDLGKPDERLARKVTYVSLDKRLHSVLEDLAQQTGVDIKCGKGKDDWQVRDIPLVVCVKDLPLGRLLRSIADATHLAFSSTAVDGVNHYRIWRDPSRERRLADYLSKRSRAALARANAEWDAWVRLGSTPEPEKKPGESDSTDLAAWRLAKVMAALPSDAKKKIFAGERVLVKVKNTSPPLSDYLTALYRDQWNTRRRVLAQGQAQNPDHPHLARQTDMTNLEIRYVGLDIRLSRDDHPRLEFALDCPPGLSMGQNGRAGQGLAPLHFDEREYIARLTKNQQKAIKDPEPPGTEYSQSLRKLDLGNLNEPALDAKLKLDRPKDDPRPPFRDIISALASASGFSIICEDFISHSVWSGDGPDVYDREITPAQVLQRIQDYASLDWFADSDARLLVGSASSWWNDLEKLAPERVISDFAAKWNGDGVEIDDLASLMLLSKAQRDEWVLDNRDINAEFFGRESGARYEPLWRLYAGLSSEDKALARSETGLPLAKLDQDYLAAIFQESARAAGEENAIEQGENLKLSPELEKRVGEWVREHYPELPNVIDQSEPIDVDFENLLADLLVAFPEVKAALQIPADADVISKLTLKLRKKEIKPVLMARDSKGDSYEEEMPKGFSLHTYSLTIEGDGVNLSICGSHSSFPMFSDKRTRQLIEDARKKEAAKG